MRLRNWLRKLPDNYAVVALLQKNLNWEKPRTNAQRYHSFLIFCERSFIGNYVRNHFRRNWVPQDPYSNLWLHDWPFRYRHKKRFNWTTDYWLQFSVGTNNSLISQSGAFLVRILCDARNWHFLLAFVNHNIIVRTRNEIMAWSQNKGSLNWKYPLYPIYIYIMRGISP